MKSIRYISAIMSIFLPLLVISCSASSNPESSGNGSPYYTPSAGRIAAVPKSRSGSASFAVTDIESREIRVFDSVGHIVRTFPVVGKPAGLAVKVNGEVLVGNTTDGKIDVYSSSGNFLRSFGSMTFPSAIAISEAHGRVFITDSKQDKVKVYNLATENFILEFGSTGNGPGQFRFPTGIAVDDANQRVIVGDFMNERVQVLDFFGAHQLTIQKSSDPKMTRPQGISLDLAGNIYIADILWHHVYVFNSAGAFVKSIGEYGTEKGQLRSPSDVLTMPDGKLLVANGRNHKIETYAN